MEYGVAVFAAVAVPAQCGKQHKSGTDHGFASFENKTETIGGRDIHFPPLSILALFPG